MSTATPNLDAALVAAQAKAKSLKRDGKNQHGGYKYATADQVADLGRALLTEHDLAWSRTKHRLCGPTLALSDIGNQAYVGDVIIEWTLRHGPTGETIAGEAQYPVITSSRRPHEKAVAASVTYGCGQILQGLLCWDREDEKHAVDRRADGAEDDVDEVAPEPRSPVDEYLARKGTRCAGKAKTLGAHVHDLVTSVSKLLGKDWKATWEQTLRKDGVVPIGVLPEQLLVEDGKRIADKLEGAVVNLEAKLEQANVDRSRPQPPEGPAAEREKAEPGDDPDEDGVPEDDAAAMREAEAVRERLASVGMPAESGSVHKVGRGRRARAEGQAPA
jgi:hypothetical protein